jgi:hypothetical protein
MRAIVQASDGARGGSEGIQAFAHTPDIEKPFGRFYDEGICRTREREEPYGSNSNSKC